MDKEVFNIEQQLKSAISLLDELKRADIEKNISKTDVVSNDYLLKKAEFLNSLNSTIMERKNRMVEEMHKVVEDFDKTYTRIFQEIIDETKKDGTKESTPQTRIFSQKVHKTRRSLLVKMYQNEDARTVYHIFIASMFVMIIGDMINTYFSKGVILDFSLFSHVFDNVYISFIFWCVLFVWSLGIVPFVQAIHYKKIKKIIWIPIYITQQLLILVVPCVFCLYFRLAMGTGLVVTCEMVRMSLKMHSYLREKLLFGVEDNEHAKFIPKFLVEKGVTLSMLNIPDIKIRDLHTELKQFIYFFFAPTLIYRDSYPKINSKRRYSMIITNIANCIGTILYTFIIFQSSCIPYFEMSWKEEINVRFVLVSWFKAMIPATMLLILMFFGLLHSWFNLCAEILMFGDREFYVDWWNVSNFADYYRKWNIVVHEWLFHYVYQDIIRFTKGRASQLFCFFMVFIISALIHELILTISMRFFYPILLVMFGGPGVIYTFFSRKDIRALNVFVWSMFFVGNGLLVVFYSWEHFARRSLDLSDKYGWKSFFIPHSWGLG